MHKLTYFKKIHSYSKRNAKILQADSQVYMKDYPQIVDCYNDSVLNRNKYKIMKFLHCGKTECIKCNSAASLNYINFDFAHILEEIKDHNNKSHERYDTVVIN